MKHELDTVVLTVDLPQHQLRAGDVGTVVHVYGSGASYELEIFTVTGKTLDVVTVTGDQVRPITDREVMHARKL